MKIPSTIDILGITYKVKFVSNISKAISKIYPTDKRNEDTVGYSTTKYGLIFIQTGLPKQIQESIFIHEVLEVMISNLSLKIKHEDIDRLETALYQTISSNKGIW